MKPPVIVWIIPDGPPPERWGLWKRCRARLVERRMRRRAGRWAS